MKTSARGRRFIQGSGRFTSGIRLGSIGAESESEVLSWKDLAPLSVTGEFRMEEPTYGFALHVVQVAVDPDTGDVRPEKLWVGYDCGRAVDRVGVANQLVGGAVAGLSGALDERVLFDQCRVRPLSAITALPSPPTYPTYAAASSRWSHRRRTRWGRKGPVKREQSGPEQPWPNAVADAGGDGGSAISSLPLVPGEVFTLLNANRTKGSGR